MKKILVSVLIIAAFAGCKKKKDCEDPGMGGAVTIICFPEHHGDAIPGSTVYLKYGSDEFPGDNPALYDASFSTADPNDDFITISGLKCGQYYIFSTGYDSTIFDNVKGGIPYSLREKEGTFNVVVPVTED